LIRIKFYWWLSSSLQNYIHCLEVLKVFWCIRFSIFFMWLGKFKMHAMQMNGALNVSNALVAIFNLMYFYCVWLTKKISYQSWFIAAMICITNLVLCSTMLNCSLSSFSQYMYVFHFLLYLIMWLIPELTESDKIRKNMNFCTKTHLRLLASVVSNVLGGFLIMDSKDIDLILTLVSYSYGLLVTVALHSECF